jgi:hypothetical protein
MKRKSEDNERRGMKERGMNFVFNRKVNLV